MFKEHVEKISKTFIEEAFKSPTLLEDMAAMEKYMAESYDKRAFIELLQNADDAFSSRVYVTYEDDNIYIANDGKPFDKDDLLSISRSGASTKERGTNIGYRGIGFKSTTYLSKEILIYSNETFFSFSKSLCAQILKKPENSIPTVRIPLLIDDVDTNIEMKVKELEAEGYTSIFVFKNSKLNIFKDELNDITKDTFLFLNNLNECTIDFDSLQKKFCIKRHNNMDNIHIILSGEGKTEEWLVKSVNNVSAAFKLEDGVIIPCEPRQAVYHCYLPTTDQVVFPCKINADFSTDPSRKHLSYDERTETAINSVSKLFFSIISDALNDNLSGEFNNILNILDKDLSFSKTNVSLKNKLANLLNSNKWLHLNNGSTINAKGYKMLPHNFSESESTILRNKSSYIKNNSLSMKVYVKISQIDKFLKQFSETEYSYEEIGSILKDKNFVDNVNHNTIGKILSHYIKECRIQSKLSKLEENFADVLIPTKFYKSETISKVVEENLEISEAFIESLNNYLINSELTWFKEEAHLSDELLPPNKKDVLDEIFSKTTIGNALSKSDLKSSVKKEVLDTFQPHITKWRDAEQKVVDIEKLLGNDATDVSIRNEGYDVLSVSPDGNKRYIEVKSVTKYWEFSLTNNEYATATQYGESYYICLLHEKSDKLQVKYIQNPIKTANFEKRVKQWEWVSTSFDSTDLVFPL